ncbi:MAG: DUF72 domain-containing protein [Conexivisphaerales archaeon]
MKILMGTSGWSYEEWVNVFYPSSSTPKLRYYSSVFDTVEVDSSFYSMPSSKVVLGWVKNTPAHFKFSPKIPKTITHDMKLRVDDKLQEELSKFFRLVGPLSSTNKLGTLLLQLPPSLEFDLDRLERFLNVLPTDEMRFAVEFRNKTWMRDDTWELLKRRKVAYTIVDEPLLPNDLITTAEHVYIRWHGHGRRVWYDYRYSRDQIDEWANKLKSLKEKEVYAYWNNHFHGFAILNCLEELNSLGVLDERREDLLRSIRSRIESPKTLFDFAGV